MNLLMEHEAKEILEKHGISTTRCIFCQSEEEAVRAARSIGFPVAMKVAGRKIVHKSDVGGVILNISNEEEAREAFRKLISIENAEGVNVQAMAEKGIEVIVGVAENEQFGSVIMFGLGGVFVEVLKDVSFRLLPLTKKDAEEMIREVKGYKLLQGYRGVKGDIGALINLLVKVGEMVEEEGIVEMDLNPVFVYDRGYCVVDARMVVGERGDREKERSGIGYTAKDVKDILNPKSIAVVGASTNPIKVGNSVLRSLIASNSIRVYPINPNAAEIYGLKSYKSLKALPEVPDVVIVALPADKVLSAVNEAAELGVKGAVIITSGFKEAEYEEGKVLENKLREIAEEKGLRIIGPNIFGVVNVVKGINMSFTPMFNEVKKGRIAFLSQSGGICHYLLHEFRDIGFSYIIHLGNRCDVDFPDVLEFLRNDPNTDVVAVYVEGVDNGRALFEQIKRLAERKRVVVMKSGKSSVADKASLSHTGSMAGDYRVFASAIKQAGGVVAETPVELMDVATALERLEGLKNAKGKGVAVLTIQAGLGIVAADIIETSGGRLAEFEEKTIKKLKELLPPITMRENPIDLSFSGLDVYRFTGVIDAISSDADTGIIMFLYAVAPPSWVMPPEVVGSIVNRMKKPAIFVYSSTPENYLEVKKALEGGNVILFDSVERAAKTAAVICQKRNNF